MKGNFFGNFASQQQFDELFSNLRGFVIIDMDNDDYVMTKDECAAVCKIVINGGDGTKKLIFSSEYDVTTAYINTVLAIFAGSDFVVSSDASENELTITAGSSRLFVYGSGTIGPQPITV